MVEDFIGSYVVMSRPYHTIRLNIRCRLCEPSSSSSGAGAAPVWLESMRGAARKPFQLVTTMTTARPKLPSVLPSQPAVQDGRFIPIV